MKKAKYSLSIVTVIIMMILTISILSYINKDKLQVDILKGNNEALGNVSLVYHPGYSMLNTSKVKLSKDGIKNSFNLKDVYYRDYIDVEEKYDSFIQYNGEVFYQNEEKIGSVTFNADYEKGIYTHLLVNNINKENNKKEKIEISLDENNKLFKKSYISPRFMTRIEDEIYIVSDMCSDNTGQDNNLLLIKVNLKNKSYKILENIKLTDKNINESKEEYVNNIIFLKDKKIYIEIASFNAGRQYTYFMIYDIPKNTIDKTDEFMNKIEKQGSLLSQNIFDYEIRDNKLSVLIGDAKGNISKLIYEIKDDNILLIENIKYDLNLGYTQTHVNNGKVRCKLIDDKIYAIVTPTAKLRVNNGKLNQYKDGLKPTEFTIFDMNKEEVTYKANLKSGNKSMDSSIFFIKN